MVVCKILWVCLAVVAMNARESQSLSDFKQDCPCFETNKDGIPISKLADNYGKHERKVVYLFKHSDPQQVSIYVPNEKNQLNFPDLTVDNLEFYGLPKSNHLYQIFMNPSTILPVVDLRNSWTTNYIDSNKSNTSKHPNIKVLDIYDTLGKSPNKNVENLNVNTDPDKQPPRIDENTKNVDLDSIGVHLVDKVTPNEMFVEETKVTRGLYDILDDVVPVTDINFVKSVQELSNGNKNNEIPFVNLKPANSPVLDKWLVEEINQIGNSGPGTSSPDTVDLLEIKTRLLYVLEKNGLRFTENGDLKDKNGYVSKISNLKLRRVMISDPVVYQKLLEGRKCVLPYNIPYLEAVFVSLVYPPKVLGLIPLKLTTLPRCKGGKCTGRMCASRTETILVGRHKVPNKWNLAPIYNTQFRNNEMLLPRMDSNDKNGNVLLTSTPAELGVDDVHDHHEGGDKKTAGEVDNDGLGIRIIGGNPATSSGTPVSSRGRSGEK